MILKVVPITEQFQDMELVNALALEAFPPEEYLAPYRMVDMAREDGFDFWALYDNEKCAMYVKEHS